jgi:hypothetical protein
MAAFRLQKIIMLVFFGSATETQLLGCYNYNPHYWKLQVPKMTSGFSRAPCAILQFSRADDKHRAPRRRKQ